MAKYRWIILAVVIVCAGFFAYKVWREHFALQQIIQRLTADSRVAEVLVTGVNYDEATRINYTTIKFLEYTAQGEALEPKYFTFAGNIIQFQSLVVRFDDRFVMAGDKIKGKSAFLFLKAFSLNGANTKEYVITPVDTVPQGYRISRRISGFEKKFWAKFWRYVFDPKSAKQAGVKNAQIEAPGVVFIPGYVYTIRIEHDGGLRIDAKALPKILRGEKIAK